MSDFSGEQKLRIVLESIIRQVPKSEQCQKYGISEEEFQAWHDHLINNGGKIFDAKFGVSKTRVKKVKEMGKVSKFLFTFSLLLNVGWVVVWAVITHYDGIKSKKTVSLNSEPIAATDSPLNLSEPKNNLSELEELAGSTEYNSDSSLEQLLSETTVSSEKISSVEAENLLARPMNLSSARVLPPVTPPPELSSEVSFLGQVYEGRHVAYAMDVGNYMLEGEGAPEKFEAMKDALLSSLVTLSPNSYFNLVLYWNLRESSALGKTILKADRENIKYAIDWITGLGSSIEDLKENRNQFVPKELLHSMPLPGVVGPWFGMSVAISFDPDLIFLLSGNCPAFSVDEIPKSHFNGLDLSQRSILSRSSLLSQVSDLTRKTARKWLVSVEAASTLPRNNREIEDMALQRLQISTDSFDGGSSISIPWNKAFETFLSSLEMNAQMIPKSHFFVSLPTNVRWPEDLMNTALEFSESSKGAFVMNPVFP